MSEIVMALTPHIDELKQSIPPQELRELVRWCSRPEARPEHAVRFLRHLARIWGDLDDKARYAAKFSCQSDEAASYRYWKGIKARAKRNWGKLAE